MTAQSRRWVFTLKAATDGELGEQLACFEEWKENQAQCWLKVCLERGNQGGDQGYVHWQGVVHTKRRLRRGGAKALFEGFPEGGGVHLEVQKGSNAEAGSYPTPEWGPDWECEFGQGLAGDEENGSRFDIALSLVDGGGTVGSILRDAGSFLPVEWVREMVKERDTMGSLTTEKRVPECRVWIGPNCTGKTTMAEAWLREAGGDAVQFGRSTAYQGAEVFRAKGLVLNEADSYPHETVGPLVRGELLAREIFGAPRRLAPERIAFTSNYELGTWWTGARAQETVTGTRERIGRSIQYTGGRGGCIGSVDDVVGGRPAGKWPNSVTRLLRRNDGVGRVLVGGRLMYELPFAPWGGPKI